MAFVGRAGSIFFWRGEFSAMRGAVWADDVAFESCVCVGFFYQGEERRFVFVI